MREICRSSETAPFSNWLVHAQNFGAKLVFVSKSCFTSNMTRLAALIGDVGGYLSIRIPVILREIFERCPGTPAVRVW
jgi:hypothetical protein